MDYKDEQRSNEALKTKESITKGKRRAHGRALVRQDRTAGPITWDGLPMPNGATVPLNF